MLGKLSVTFGPCQTPTLWFCAHRHDQIAAFVPTAYWTVEGTITVGGYELRAVSPRGRMWAEAEATAAVAATAGAAAATVAAPPTVARQVQPRPLPLNTVALLKAASEVLGLGPGDAMYLSLIHI